MILPDSLKTQVEPLINQYWDKKRSGSVGYIGGLPSMDQLLEWKDMDHSMSQLRDMAEAEGANVLWNDAMRSAASL